jgi:phage baseplate assembly protein W
MSEQSENTFIGVGWGSPPTFVKGANQVIMTKDIININENLTLLLNTKVGERALSPDFGSKLNKFLFSAQSGLIAKEIQSTIKKTIHLFEPRITVDEVNIALQNQENGLIIISVSYTVKKVNSRHNFVYPFYINEGTYLDI